MLCKDVMYEIEKEYPLNYALSWDNVGLLVGRDDKEVKRIYIALDATDEVIDEAGFCRRTYLKTDTERYFLLCYAYEL